MAYSKIKPIRTRLDRCIDYVINPKKTALDAAIGYIENPNKTEQCLYVSTYNCVRETAAIDMAATRNRWKKERKNAVLGYHLIVSYAPGEVTPQEAHSYGQQLAEKLYAEKYEVVVTTHTDRKHIHNHIVFNSVSFLDGRMYRNSFKDYFGDIRSVSDALCREHGLSVIAPKERGKNYAEWQAEKERKPTIRSMIRQDIDEVIDSSFTYRSFLEGMQKRGYFIKYGSHVKHTAVKPAGSQRYFRLSSMGKGYSEEEIKERLMEKRLNGRYLPPKKKPKGKARLNGKYHKSRKIKGIRALYWRYLYLLGKVRKRTASKKVSPLLYDDVIQFEKYVKQNKFLCENKIDTTEDLMKMKSFFDGEISRLIAERKILGKEVRRRGEPVRGNADYQQYHEQLKEYRAKVRLCNSILETEGRIRNNLQNIERIERKEVEKYEPGQRSSRTNDKRNAQNQRRNPEADGDRG